MNIRANFKTDMQIWRVSQGTAPNFETTKNLLSTVKCLYNEESHNKKYAEDGETLILSGTAHIEPTDILNTDEVVIAGINYEVVNKKDPSLIGHNYIISLREVK